jgi:hypothetical protein
MPIFKTLRATGSNEHILNGRVDCGWESWNSLDSALNELGAANWEVQTPLYGSLPGQLPNTWPVALILINRSTDMAGEIQRQINKLKMEIAEIGEKFGSSSRARELQGILDGLLEKTKSPRVSKKRATTGNS